MPKLYPSEFRGDVVRVARGRKAGVSVSLQECWQGRKVGLLRREHIDGKTVCDTDRGEGSPCVVGDQW